MCPPYLVHDFNMYDPQGPAVDLFQAVRNLHEHGLPHRVEARRASVTQLTDALPDGMKPNDGCEFMSEFALQMPIIVFLQIVGLPIEHRERLLTIANGVVSPEEGALRDDAMQQKFDYLRLIISECAADLQDDVFSKMVTGTHNGRPLSVDEMLGLSATILAGGLDTLAATLGYFARYLAESPEVRKRLRKVPQRSAPQSRKSSGASRIWRRDCLVSRNGASGPGGTLSGASALIRRAATRRRPAGTDR